MEIALYVRVSTSRQQQAQTIDQQLDRLRAHVATQPTWHLAEEHIYRDDGYSGANLNRPGLDRLMATYVIPSAPATPVGCDLVRSKWRWWSSSSPGIPIRRNQQPYIW